MSLARELLELIPENSHLIRIYASCGNATLFVDIEKRKIQSIVNNLESLDTIPDRDLQEIGEDLASELGKILETKIIVLNLKRNLDNLP